MMAGFWLLVIATTTTCATRVHGSHAASVPVRANCPPTPQAFIRLGGSIQRGRLAIDVDRDRRPDEVAVYVNPSLPETCRYQLVVDTARSTPTAEAIRGKGVSLKFYPYLNSALHLTSNNRPDISVTVANIGALRDVALFQIRTRELRRIRVGFPGSNDVFTYGASGAGTVASDCPKLRHAVLTVAARRAIGGWRVVRRQFDFDPFTGTFRAGKPQRLSVRHLPLRWREFGSGSGSGEALDFHSCRIAMTPPSR